MDLFKYIFDFYNNGNALNVVLAAFFSVTYVFAVTFTVCLFAKEQRAKNKRFFIWLSAFAVLVSVGSLVLDYFSARRFSVFFSAAFAFGLSGIMMPEYFILCVQSKICVKEKKPVKTAEKVCACALEKRAPVAACANNENAVKPAKKAGISEVPLRKTERVYMQRDTGSDVLCEGFLLDCIKKLKGKNLSAEDGYKLSRAENNLTVPIKTDTAEDKRRVSDTCGSLITLLAKYK